MTGPQRRSQLIGIGRGLFALRGLDGTTIEEIAAAAGVSKPVIYEHFGSKEGLYTQVVECEFRILLGSISDALSEEAKPRVLVERAALALLSYIEDRTEGFRILMRDAPPTQPEGAFSTLLSHVTARVEYILADEFARRGFTSADGAMYAQMLVGHGGDDGPVVAGQPDPGQARSGRPPGQPRLERPHRPPKRPGTPQRRLARSPPRGHLRGQRPFAVARADLRGAGPLAVARAHLAATGPIAAMRDYAKVPRTASAT